MLCTRAWRPRNASSMGSFCLFELYLPRHLGTNNVILEESFCSGYTALVTPRLLIIVEKAQFIGLYRQNAIAIQDEVGDSNGGNVYYVTMRITFNIPEFTRIERNSRCDVLHIAPVRVANIVLDDALAAIQTSR